MTRLVYILAPGCGLKGNSSYRPVAQNVVIPGGAVLAVAIGMATDRIQLNFASLSPESHADWLYGLAEDHIRNQRWADAEKALLEALRLRANDPVYQAYLGWVMFRRGPRTRTHIQSAIAYLRAAIGVDRACSFAYQALGEIALYQDEPDAALKWWEQCLQRDGKNLHAARGIRLLTARAKKRQGSVAHRIRRFFSSSSRAVSGRSDGRFGARRW